MLASDILPPRTVSSRGTISMLKRLAEDTSGNYRFKLIPATALAQRDISHTAALEPTKRHEAPNRLRLALNADPTQQEASEPDWSWLPASARKSPTGLACLYIKNRSDRFIPRLAIAPAFPIVSEKITNDWRSLLPAIDPPARVGIILLRYGHVAVCIAHDESIVASKVSSRFVPNKHRAGGQSANRFKRGREKWAREFFDKSARIASDLFSNHPHRIDWLMLGGDRHVLNAFLERANFPDGLAGCISGRRLNVVRPRRSVLDEAVRDAWSSTVFALSDSAISD